MQPSSPPHRPGLRTQSAWRRGLPRLTLGYTNIRSRHSAPSLPKLMPFSHCVCKSVHSASAVSNVLTGPSIDCKIWSPRSHLNKSHPHQRCTGPRPHLEQHVRDPGHRLDCGLKGSFGLVRGSLPAWGGWGGVVGVLAPPPPAPFPALLSTLDRLVRGHRLLSLAGGAVSGRRGDTTSQTS